MGPQLMGTPRKASRENILLKDTSVKLDAENSGRKTKQLIAKKVLHCKRLWHKLHIWNLL